jgi:hypothetical protein
LGLWKVFWKAEDVHKGLLASVNTFVSSSVGSVETTAEPVAEVTGVTDARHLQLVTSGRGGGS